MYVEYNPNNSGGSFWLRDEDWYALEKAGWKIKWVDKLFLYDKKGEHVKDEDGTPKLVDIDYQIKTGEKLEETWGFSQESKDNKPRWLGTLARYAYRTGLELDEAIEEWERITAQDSQELGCSCCGPPHDFTYYDNKGKYISSMNHTRSYDDEY